MNNKPDYSNDPVAYFKAQKEQQKKKSRKIIAIVIPSIIVIGAVLMFLTGSLMKKSDAYKTAVESIKQDANVQKQTGGIKDFGYFVTGQIKTVNDAGEANLSIKVEGQKEDVTVFVYLTKDNAGWHTQEMNIE